MNIIADPSKKLLYLLDKLEIALQELSLWQIVPPNSERLDSSLPFALDMLESHEWLQWIFIPRIRALIEGKQELPKNISIAPYIEETMQGNKDLAKLITAIKNIETLLLSL